MNETMALLREAQKGNQDAKEELVKQNLGLVGSIVRRFEHRGHDREELFQIGSIGLIKAIDKFDLTYEVAFSTYAVPLISGEIRRFLRDDGLVRISRSLKENGTVPGYRTGAGGYCDGDGSQYGSRIYLPQYLPV